MWIGSNGGSTTNYHYWDSISATYDVPGASNFLLLETNLAFILNENTTDAIGIDG
jgi:hypothetical protein